MNAVNLRGLQLPTSDESSGEAKCLKPKTQKHKTNIVKYACPIKHPPRFVSLYPSILRRNYFLPAQQENEGQGRLFRMGLQRNLLCTAEIHHS